jgi:predicted amidohydrolase YtcJ
MSREAIEEAARLGVSVDIQPAWLRLDGSTLLKQFGYERLRYFQPLRSLAEAGVLRRRLGSHAEDRSRCDPLTFIIRSSVWPRPSIAREGRGFAVAPEEGLSREQAIRFYTINNARILLCEDRLGSLEAGKLADLVVLDTDLLTCPANQIGDTKVWRTYIGGRQVHPRPDRAP